LPVAHEAALVFVGDVAAASDLGARTNHRTIGGKRVAARGAAKHRDHHKQMQ
jgi:hypothetical protein